MRTLTKSGIRDLNAKYRSILRKCFLLNMMCFALSMSASAGEIFPLFSTNYDEFVAQLESNKPLSGTLDSINQREPLLPASAYSIQKLDSETGRTFSIFLPDKDKTYYYKVTEKTSSPLESDDRLFADKVSSTDKTVILTNKQYIIGDYIGNTINKEGGNISFGTLLIKANTNELVGTFINNQLTGWEDGALYGTLCNDQGIISNIHADFINNRGRSIENYSGDIQQLSGIFLNNSFGDVGGAIYNEGHGHIGRINAIFLQNNAIAQMGGGIFNASEAYIDEISATFLGNTSNEGGALGNNGKISTIFGNFESNSVTSDGGAIYNNGTIGNADGTGGIYANFTGNEAVGKGGAIYNTGIIGTSNEQTSSIMGKFESNSAHDGGAIYNTTSTGTNQIGLIYSIQADFLNNRSVQNGGAIWNSSDSKNPTINIIADTRDIIFNQNYVTTSDGKGGAIYNTDTVSLFADEGRSITFVGGPDDPDNNKYDIDGIYNTGTLNINGDGEGLNYTGTVNLYNVAGTGTTYINGGTVNANGNFTQNKLYIDNAEMKVNGTLDVVTIDLLNSSVLELSKTTVEKTQNKPIQYLNLGGSILNLQNNSVGILHVTNLNFESNDNNLMIDADLGKSQIDQIARTGGEISGTLNISNIRILSDGTPHSLLLFTETIPTNVTGNLTNLPGPVFMYNANYDDGKISFTRTGVNPYIYAPSTMAQTTANITGQIAGVAMDKLDTSVSDSEKGLAGGDLPKANNAWIKVMGFDDNVEFKKFNTIDSKTMTIAGGFNTDKVKFDNVDAAFGLYAGYIGGRQKYSDNKIEQDGGYVGLSSELTKGNAFLLSTVNAGFINNEAENMYGTDKFDTRWFGIGLKGGYNYALTDAWTLQPNIYAGYTLVNTEDYISKSGVRINNNNLNFFEIDPGFKLMTQIDKNWLGFIQGKYAIVMDNGGETKANEYILPNISAKNYFEYGVGMNKPLTDAWSLNGEINRRDGGRTGWNGSVEFKYNF